jgi:hypothetical protein
MTATVGHSVAWRIPDDLLGAFCRVNHVAPEPTGCGWLDGLHDDSPWRLTPALIAGRSLS